MAMLSKCYVIGRSVLKTALAGVGTALRRAETQEQVGTSWLRSPWPQSQWLRGVIMAVAIGWFGWGAIAPPAHALATFDLADIAYKECPAEIGAGSVVPGSSLEATCFLIYGKAINKTGKPIVNADVFGRLYDANHNSVMENRTRLGSIDEVPPGTSEFEIRVSVPASLPLPLQLEQFKASGFTGKVRR